MITHTISLLGHRESNEDQHEIFENLNNENENENENKKYKNINLYAIFDGHGGKDVSKYLKDNMATYFTSNYMKFNINNTTEFKKYIEKVFDHLQIKLERRFKNFSYNIGSTALLLIIYKIKNNTHFY